jgi:hypothetical protein
MKKAEPNFYRQVYGRKDASEQPSVRNLSKFFEYVRKEINRATGLYGPIRSYHEAHSIILEEFEEFWDEVKQWPRTYSAQNVEKELIQMVAMCCRTLMDLHGMEEE